MYCIAEKYVMFQYVILMFHCTVIALPVVLKSFFVFCCLQVSVNVAKKTLFLFNINDPDNPIELAFQQRYGSIVDYKWWAPTVTEKVND